MEKQIQTYRVARPHEKRVLASAVRQNLLDTLIASREASVRELAAQVGMRVSALYYHLELLERAGLVVRRGARRGTARHEASFAPRATRIALDYGLDSGSGRAATQRLGQTLLRAAARDFAAGVRSPSARSEGRARNLWVSRTKAWLTQRQVETIHRRLAELEELLLSARRGPGKALHAVSWVLAPVESADRKRRGRRERARQSR